VVVELQLQRILGLPGARNDDGGVEERRRLGRGWRRGPLREPLGLATLAAGPGPGPLPAPLPLACRVGSRLHNPTAKATAMRALAPDVLPRRPRADPPR